MHSQIDEPKPVTVPTAEESKAMLDAILYHHPDVLRSFILETAKSLINPQGSQSESSYSVDFQAPANKSKKIIIA